jgi:hypothetical protein
MELRQRAAIVAGSAGEARDKGQETRDKGQGTRDKALLSLGLTGGPKESPIWPKGNRAGCESAHGRCRAGPVGRPGKRAPSEFLSQHRNQGTKKPEGLGNRFRPGAPNPLFTCRIHTAPKPPAVRWHVPSELVSDHAIDPSASVLPTPQPW